MSRPRKLWTDTIEESGIAVRVYERLASGPLYREVRYGGRKHRKSFGHHDRALALEQARALARALAEQTFAGSVGPVTLGAVVQLYLEHRAPQLSAQRRQRSAIYMALVRKFFGDASSSTIWTRRGSMHLSPPADRAHSRLPVVAANARASAMAPSDRT